MTETKSEIQSQADKYMFQTYGRFPITLVKGEGCRVWDETGKEYIDFVGGIAVCALGHSSPIVTKALIEQSKELVHVSNLYYTVPQTRLAKLLVENSFADRVFFCNSGAEANEAAIKIARRYSYEKYGTGRNTIISMKNSFHGRTMATMSATGQDKIKKGYDPLLTGFKFVPFNDASAIEMAIDETVCGVMLEPVQGEGGVICAEKDYLKKVREICDRKNLLLIFDEVQAGVGRTGRLFAHENFGVFPDIMSLAKALGNGLPIGAMLAKEELNSVFGPGSHATTFGGTPLVTTVAEAVIKTIINDGILEKCRETGRYFREKLGELKETYGFIKDVRGIGLITGLELDIHGAPIVTECIKRGFLINCSQEKVLRFVPPLIISREEVDMLINCLNEIFRKC
ncbi:MAG: aspartate aminotransferase family protein [Deltaproteobacteria bacterium]|nr:aspartate aminotransferase family protein [Deltaproteobacteria bacterium]